MKTICITGTMSGAGKTSFAEALLSHLDNWAACKVTACIGGTVHKCPRGKDKTCGVCSSLKKDYEIEEEEKVIPASKTSADKFVKGKDTERLLRAGAEAVLWVKAKPRFLDTAVKEAIAKLKGYDGIVFEGNHVLKVLNPDIAVMVLSRNKKFKKSAKDILNKVDIFVEDVAGRKVINKIIGLVEM